MAFYEEVRQNRRLIIERGGEYNRVEGPGRHIIMPWDSVAASMPTAQEPYELWGGNAPWITFQDGTARPMGARAFISVLNPERTYSVQDDGTIVTGVPTGTTADDPSAGRNGCFRAFYNTPAWRTAAGELIENAVRSYLNVLLIDDAISGGRAGFNLLERMRTHIGNEPQDIEVRQGVVLLLAALARIGVGLERITISSFQEDDATAQVRQRRREAQVSLDLSETLADAQAMETEIGLKKPAAEAIATRINRFIFYSVKPSLAKIHEAPEKRNPFFKNWHRNSATPQ